MVKEGYKECPMCAEEVKLKAKICRFCRYEFEKFEEKEKIEIKIKELQGQSLEVDYNKVILNGENIFYKNIKSIDISYGKNNKSGELKIEVYYDYGSENKTFYYFFDESKNKKMEEEKIKLDFNHSIQIKKNKDKNISKKKDNRIFLLIIFLTLSITAAIVYKGESKKKVDLIQNLKPISIIYNINEYSPEVYEITSPMSKDIINIANLIPNQLTKNMAQRVKKITKGQIKKLDNGYEIFNTSGDWPDKYFIINSQVSIEYNIKDGKLKNIYEHLKINKGKKLKDYIF